MHHSRRKFYEETSTHLGKYCRKLGLTPNFITAVSLLCAIASGVFFWKGELILGVVFIIITSVMDMLDGATARAGQMGSLFGGILDHVSDRYGEFFILLGIGIRGADFAGPGTIDALTAVAATFALFGMLIASYTRAAAESIGNLPTCAVGMMGRLEKFILIMIGALLENFFPGNYFMVYALALVGLTSIITSVQRLAFAGKELKKRQS